MQTEENRAPNLLPITIVLAALLWIFTTTGGSQVFVNEMLSEAYDSQAAHFLKGDAAVDGSSIRHESIVVNGRAVMYFGPFPALARIPLNLVYSAGMGHWARVTGFCAGLIALVAFAGLLRIALRDSRLSWPWRNVIGNVCMVGFAFASPLLLLLGNLSIYGEAIIWGFAWSIAALYFVNRSRKTEGFAFTRSLIGFSVCAGAALLSRVTFGIPLLLIAPILALPLLRRGQLRNLAAVSLPIGFALLFYLLLSYARFNNFTGMNWEGYTNPMQREFAQKHGTFSLARIPYSFADYFFLRRPQLNQHSPYLKSDRHGFNNPELYVNSFSETYASLIWCSPWILFGAIIGLMLLFRRKSTDDLDRAIAAVLLFQVIIILTFQGLAQRYVGEFYPFLVFTFVVFLARSRAVLVHTQYVLIALVFFSVVVNSLSTVSWLVEIDRNVPEPTREKWKQFLGRPPPPPPPAPAEQG